MPDVDYARAQCGVLVSCFFQHTVAETGWASQHAAIIDQAVANFGSGFLSRLIGHQVWASDRPDRPVQFQGSAPWASMYVPSQRTIYVNSDFSAAPYPFHEFGHALGDFAHIFGNGQDTMGLAFLNLFNATVCNPGVSQIENFATQFGDAFRDLSSPPIVPGIREFYRSIAAMRGLT